MAVWLMHSREAFHQRTQKIPIHFFFSVASFLSILFWAACWTILGLDYDSFYYYLFFVVSFLLYAGRYQINATLLLLMDIGKAFWYSIVVFYQTHLNGMKGNTYRYIIMPLLCITSKNVDDSGYCCCRRLNVFHVLFECRSLDVRRSLRFLTFDFLPICTDGKNGSSSRMPHSNLSIDFYLEKEWPRQYCLKIKINAWTTAKQRWPIDVCRLDFSISLFSFYFSFSLYYFLMEV